ncbi:MAG: CoA-binding protein [Balneolaceae bacterium]
MKSTFNKWYKRKKKDDSEADQKVEQLLQKVKNVAVVGISRNTHRDSHYVGRYLKNAGYRIIPVNPGAKEILEEKAYPDLKSIPDPIEVVDIFRRPEDIPGIVEEALSVHPKAIWLQLGTGKHPDIQKKVEGHGIQFIQNRCMKVDHQFLIRDKKTKTGASCRIN